jgi:hypothetical protein
MTHPIIEKILKLETLEKELLGEQRLIPLLEPQWGKPPIKSNFVDETRHRNYGQILNVTSEDDDSTDPSSYCMSNEELAHHLLNGAKLFVNFDDAICIQLKPDSEFETDEQYEYRHAEEIRRYENACQRYYKKVGIQKQLISDLKQSITDLTTEIDKELEDPEIVAIVETYLKSKNNQPQ